jgi:ABC-type branched-subunit amino acid transport system ATPase component
MPGSADAMIRVEKASLRYGDVEAVQGVSFSVAAAPCSDL